MIRGSLIRQKVRIAEAVYDSYYDSSASHELGHIPGAVLIDWKKNIKKKGRHTMLRQLKRLD